MAGGQRGRGGGHGRPCGRCGARVGGHASRGPGGGAVRRGGRTGGAGRGRDRPGHQGGRQAALGSGGGGGPWRRHPALLRPGRAAPRRGHPARSQPRHPADGAPPSARRYRPCDAVELPGGDPAVEGGPEPRVRQRDRAEALGGILRRGPDAGGDDRPAPALGCVPGRPRCRETGRALTGHPGVAAVSFTGSVPAGHDVVARAAGRGARVQAEMGGQNASVVLADADFERAATAIAYAAMGYAGQKCTATSRIIVEDAAYAKFRDQLTSAVAGLGVLDPGQDGTLVGPVITERARDSALAGGAALDAPGFYLAPTLVELDSPEGPLATEEVFAPVAAVLRADSAEAAVRIANDVRYGLVTALFTQDLGRALRLADQFDAGMVRVNAPTSGVDFHAPFGGAKQSSYGPREQGLAARDFYTETRTVTIVP